MISAPSVEVALDVPEDRPRLISKPLASIDLTLRATIMISVDSVFRPGRARLSREGIDEGISIQRVPVSEHPLHEGDQLGG